MLNGNKVNRPCQAGLRCEFCAPAMGMSPPPGEHWAEANLSAHFQLSRTLVPVSSVGHAMSRSAPKEALFWFALLTVSLLLGCFLKSEGFPAAFLVGSMLSGIAFSLLGAGLALPRTLFFCAQSLIGCAVAQSITAAILVTICEDWALMLLIVGSSVLAGGLVGWTLVKSRMLPGTTAAWGSTPGAASAMVAMAEAYGADARLVALMQYLRVLVVVLTASMVSHVLLGSAPVAPVPVAAPVFSLRLDAWQPLLVTLAVAAAGGFLGQWLKLPAGAMLVPMILGALLHASGVADLYQPFWLQASASVLLGWYVGLGFDRALLISAFRMLPRLLLSSVLLMGLCGLSAYLLFRFSHTDALTAYLSTSPGGIDSVILIAMGSQADVPFVVAVQTLRLFIVILIGPGIARMICRYA